MITTELNENGLLLRNLKENYRESTSRFSGTEWADIIQSMSIGIFGLGGIGSWTSLLISRLNPRLIELCDFDTVEAANMSGQLYGGNDILKLKVDACTSNIMEFTDGNFDIITHMARAEDILNDIPALDVAITGFDSMDARKMFFNVLKDNSSRARYIIDGRLSIDTYQVIVVDMSNEHAKDVYYRHFLFDSIEAERTVCSLKQTSFLACMIASTITNIVTLIAYNSKCGLEMPFPIPFMYEYNSIMMTSTIKYLEDYK